jgi:predicted RNA binding protein YcfA (HicA-like mRNA interferase family)
MGPLPVLKAREVAVILAQLGFLEVRQRGSHRQYRHKDGRCTTVPFHPVLFTRAVTYHRPCCARLPRTVD